MMLIATLVYISNLFHFSKCACSSGHSAYHLKKMSAGEISSQGYPNYYNAGEDCTWYLHPPDNEYAMVYLHIDVDMKDSLHCTGENKLIIPGTSVCGKESVCILYGKYSNGVPSSNKCIAWNDSAYSACMKSHVNWPIVVNFKTVSALPQPGFKMEYRFVKCENENSAGTADPVLNIFGNGNTTLAETKTDLTTLPHVAHKDEGDSQLVLKIVFPICIFIAAIFVIVAAIFVCRVRKSNCQKSKSSSQTPVQLLDSTTTSPLPPLTTSNVSGKFEEENIYEMDATPDGPITISYGLQNTGPEVETTYKTVNNQIYRPE